MGWTGWGLYNIGDLVPLTLILFDREKQEEQEEKKTQRQSIHVHVQKTM